MLQREAKSAKRKAKSYKNDGLTTTKASIPMNIHTGLALSGVPAPAKTVKKISGRVVVKTTVVTKTSVLKKTSVVSKSINTKKK